MSRLKLSRDFYRSLAVVLVLAAVAFGVTSYLRITTPPDEETYIPRPEHLTPEIKLLQQYVRIDTSNPPGRESAGAEFLAAELRRNGITSEVIPTAPGRANLYARLSGETPGEGLLLLHHIDVVPASRAGWMKPPFEAELLLNQMWGRGTLDMKGIGICHLEAFIDLAKSGRKPKRDLVFLATADEETGGKVGLVWLLEHRPDIFRGIKYAVNEGGIPEMRAEKLVYFGVEVGSKQFVQVRLHAPQREQLRQARIALEPHVEPFDPERILPEVKEFFRAIAPYRVQGREVLEDVDRAIAEGEFWRLQSSFRALTQNTLVPFGAEPDGTRFGMTVFLHNLPDEIPSHAIRRIEQIVAPYGVTVEVLESMGPTRISHTDTPVFRLVSRMVKKYFGEETPVGPLILAYATNDSRYLRARGVEAYGFWPFPVDFHQSQGVHAENERVRLDWFMTGVQMTREMVWAYCFAE
jgi:acetylornithine deacetylase/succinyl-diaminopimelate desuccinylase-like protein